MSLPPSVAALVESIDKGQILGASRQLDVLGDCLLGIAQARGSEPEKLRADVAALVQHVELTRGGSSKAVSNGMSLMTNVLLSPRADSPGSETKQRLTSAVEAFRRDLRGWLEEVRLHGARVLSRASVLLAYDYSSTVAQVVGDLARRRDGLRVFVPEARSLDGGIKYLRDWQRLGLTVHLIPDSAITWAIGACDAVVVGAETLSAEGGCYNTIGTASTAAEAVRASVPVHVLSVLLKTDLGLSSDARPTPSLDFLPRLEPLVPPTEDRRLILRGDFPDLDYTPPEKVTSVVTELGVLSCAEVEAAARQVLDQPHD